MACILSLQLACAASGGRHTPAADRREADELTLFASVVHTIRDSSRSLLGDAFAADSEIVSRYPLRIDPRPADPFTFPFVPLASVAPELVAERSRVLTQLGVRSGDATVLKDCPGPMAVDAERRICPPDPLFIGLVQLPDTIRDPSEVRVFFNVSNSHSTIGLAKTYTMKRLRDRWELAEQSLTTIIE